MIKKYTLTFVSRKTTKADGTPLISKAGKPWTSLSLKTQELGDIYIGGFDSIATQLWKAGDLVELILTQNGEYLNFSVPKPEDKLSERIDSLEVRLSALESVGTGSRLVAGINLTDRSDKAGFVKAESLTKSPEINTDNGPF